MKSNRLSLLVKRHTSWLMLIAYALLSLAMTWPLFPRLGTHVPGGTSDLWTHRWTFWWIKQSIVKGCNPFYTRLLFYPQGTPMTLHNIAWVNIAVWLPLQAVLGGNLAYSLTFLIFCTLNGFAMYLLVRGMVDSLPAAFIGGLVYAYWPFLMSQYGHPNMKAVCWVPLALLYLRRTLKKQRTKDALLAALFLALIGLTRWQQLMMASFAIGLYLLCQSLKYKAWRSRRTFRLLVLIGFVSGTLMAPLATPVARALLRQDNIEEVLFSDTTNEQTDVLAYVLPTRYHPLWVPAAEKIYDNFLHNKVYIPFLGYTALALALYGAIKRWKQARSWLLVAGIYVTLALGPILRVNGQLYPKIPMPYRLVGDLFFIRAVRVPNRFNLFLNLPVAMMVAFGVEAITHQRARKLVIPLTLIVSALILREYSLVPYHTEHPDTPDWYHQLAQEPGQFAVLDLPIGLQTFNKQYMFYQITHRKPLVEGKIARPPHEVFAFVESNPLLSHLHQHNIMNPKLVNVSHQLRTLRDANIRYIILHKGFATREQMTTWRDWLTFEPTHEDEDLVVYRTDPRLGHDFTFAHTLTEEIGLIRASVAPTDVIQGGVVRVDARWGSSAAPDQNYDVCLALSDPAGEVAHSRCVPLSSAWPAFQWEADEIVRSSYDLHVPVSLEPAAYSLALTLAEPSTGASVGRPADLGHLRIDALNPMHSLQVLFGDAIWLHGYDLHRSDDILKLTFYWQAQQEMNTSYKVFVHLIDPTTGEIVAQSDAVPADWSRPTTGWLPGEYITDTHTLVIPDDAPAGDYVLQAGLYSPGGERLTTPDGADAISIIRLSLKAPDA